MSLCRSSLDRSFGVYLHNVFAYALIFRRCFFLEDLERRSRPPTVALRGARSFFITSLIREKSSRLQNAEGPKNTFPKLVAEKRLKYSAPRAVHRSASVSGMAVRLLPLQHYIKRRVGEKLPHHSLLSRHCAIKIFNRSQSFLHCAFEQALHHYRSASS